MFQFKYFLLVFLQNFFLYPITSNFLRHDITISLFVKVFYNANFLNICILSSYDFFFATVSLITIVHVCVNIYKFLIKLYLKINKIMLNSKKRIIQENFIFLL